MQAVVRASHVLRQGIQAVALGLLWLAPGVPQAASLYLCKAYSGGSLWSAQPCQGRQALTDRIVSVPDGLPFKEQVRLGEQARIEAEHLRQPDAGSGRSAPVPKHKAVHRSGPAANKQASCAALDAKVTKLDAQARQAQTAKAQDKIAAQRRRLREQQAELHC
jgi:hypothetical protein